ncbi:MAG: 4'-phosphopantetheinyl transferase superfamily protein [Deltaproteobacteria bacterium]|nr:4'-phosphopantetheinyl transferase superfamily protein [Deltaproteobacteria bacterium]
MSRDYLDWFQRLRSFDVHELELGCDDLHGWRTTSDQPLLSVQELKSLISRDEVERAERFHFERDRTRFLARRGLLRIILGYQLGVDPHTVRFRYPASGKPEVAAISDKGKLCFSMSHSHGLALYVIGWNRNVGIDVEKIRPLHEVEPIARRFFSTSEATAIQKLPESQKMLGFFNCWTRKEAYLKATGDGLSRPLDEIIASLVPGETAKLMSVAGDKEEPSRWSLIDLTPAPGYVAAVCVEAPGVIRNYECAVGR